MSSLRISHQNRASGATTAGGDTARSEHAGDGASFALALGAAAGVVPKDAAVLLGGKSGDASDGSAAPRKRADNPAKSADVAAVAADIGGSLLAAPVVVEPAASAGTGGDAAVAGGAVSAGVATVGPLTDGATNVGVATGGPLSASDPLNVVISTVAGEKAIGASDTIASGAAHAANSVPTLTAPVPQFAPTSAPTPAGTAAGDQPPPGQAQPATVDPASLAVPVSQLVAPALRPAAPAHLGENSASGTPDAPTISAAADVSGVASALPLATPNGPSPGGAHAVGGVATGAPVLPAMVGSQAATAGGGGAFGFAPRDRFAAVAAAQDAGSVSAAAAATAANGTASAPPSSAAAPTPGVGPDPTGAATIADQVAGQLARMVSNGSREMVLRLHPPELGDLTVRVTISGRDVSAWFASPQPQVQSAISAAIGQLQTSLGNAGYNLNGAWVGGDASGGRQQQAALPSASPAIGAPLAAATAVPAAAVSRSASSGLNIYV